MKKQITIVIPFYNEATRTCRVISKYKHFSCFKEIIAVDDGSTDNGLSHVREKHPDITLITIVKNQGKGAAVARTLDAVTTKYVYLADADVTHIKQKEIEPILTEAVKNNIDYVLFRRIDTVWFSKLLRFDLLLTGERLMKTEDLKALCTRFKPTGYDVELMQNKYMRLKNKQSRWSPVSIQNTFKLYKYPLNHVIRREYAMYRQVVRNGGFEEYIKQLYWSRQIQEIR